MTPNMGSPDLFDYYTTDMNLLLSGLYIGELRSPGL
jgi:hypothetical protein